MSFANIGCGPASSHAVLKTGDELDLMLGCIDNDTEVAMHDDENLVTPPISAKYATIMPCSLIGQALVMFEVFGRRGPPI